MYRRTARPTALFGFTVLLFAGACSDSTGVSGDPLTQQEAFTIFAELQSAIGDALNNVTTAPPATADGIFLTPLPKVTGQCDEGGSVSIEGEYEDNLDPVTGAGTFTFQFVQSINDCIVSVDPTSFTVNGAPNLIISGDLAISENFLITGTYTMQGAFRYAADDDRTGTCDVDVTIDLGNRSTAGDVCGRNVGS